MLFFTYFPNVRTNFCYYIYWLRFKMIPRISILFGSRGEATDILTMIGMQKCNFSGKSENWTYVYACCTCKWITNNEWLVCIYSLDFPLNIYVTKIGQLHISNFSTATVSWLFTNSSGNALLVIEWNAYETYLKINHWNEQNCLLTGCLE